jgi:hypothetical protein
LQYPDATDTDSLNPESPSYFDKENELVENAPPKKALFKQIFLIRNRGFCKSKSSSSNISLHFNIEIEMETGPLI